MKDCEQVTSSLWDLPNKKDGDDLYRLDCGSSIHSLQSIGVQTVNTLRSQIKRAATCLYLCTSAFHQTWPLCQKSIPRLREAPDHNAEKCRRNKVNEMRAKGKVVIIVWYTAELCFSAPAATSSTETEAGGRSKWAFLPLPSSKSTSWMPAESRMYALANEAAFNLEANLHEVLIVSSALRNLEWFSTLQERASATGNEKGGDVSRSV